MRMNLGTDLPSPLVSSSAVEYFEGYREGTRDLARILVSNPVGTTCLPSPLSATTAVEDRLQHADKSDHWRTGYVLALHEKPRLDRLA